MTHRVLTSRLWFGNKLLVNSNSDWEAYSTETPCSCPVCLRSPFRGNVGSVCQLVISKSFDDRYEGQVSNSEIICDSNSGPLVIHTHTYILSHTYKMYSETEMIHGEKLVSWPHLNPDKYFTLRFFTRRLKCLATIIAWHRGNYKCVYSKVIQKCWCQLFQH